MTARRHLQMSIEWKERNWACLKHVAIIPIILKGSHFKEYRQQMVTTDDSAGVFAVFDEVESVFGETELSI